MNELSLAAVLVREAEGLRVMSFGPEALALVFGLVLVALLQAGLRSILARWGRSRTRRDLAQVLRFAIRVVAITLMVSLVVHRFFTVAPVLTTAGLILGTSGLVFSFGIRAQDWLLAWMVMLRGMVRVGDHLEVGKAQGVVERLGLLRVTLKAGDGSRVLVPTRSLTQDSLRLSTRHQTVPVEVSTAVTTAVTPEALRRLRQLAGLCPYRSWLSEVTVHADLQRITVRLQAWSLPAALQAEAYLRDALENGSKKSKRGSKR